MKARCRAQDITAVTVVPTCRTIPSRTPASKTKGRDLRLSSGQVYILRIGLLDVVVTEMVSSVPSLSGFEGTEPQLPHAAAVRGEGFIIRRLA